MVNAPFETAVFREQAPGLAQVFSDSLTEARLFISGRKGHACLEVYAADCITQLKRRQKEQQLTVDFEPRYLEKAQHNEKTVRCLATQLIATVEDLQKYIDSDAELKAFFILQRNSYSPLQTSYELYKDLCRRRDVSPQFNDYILYFGSRDNEVELTPPAMRMRSFRQDPEALTFECMRTNALTGQTWIFVTVPESAKFCLDDYFAHSQLGVDRNILEIVILLVDTVMGQWRPYVVALLSETELHATQSLGSSLDDQGPMGQVDVSQRQEMMLLDDRIGNSLVAIKATEHDLRSLMESSLRTGLCPDVEDRAILAITEKLKELENLSLKLESLRLRLAGVASLVTNFLDLSNGFALQQLGKESRQENEHMRILSQRMHVLAEKNTQDASATTVLTIVGLM
ncbi:hypothetical protein LTS15_010364 [Exophiala xenobiotica]|nr:hypothetical protein LTS15_010364 [Exophiala xenobiotica]